MGLFAEALGEGFIELSRGTGKVESSEFSRAEDPVQKAENNISPARREAQARGDPLECEPKGRRGSGALGGGRENPVIVPIKFM